MNTKITVAFLMVLSSALAYWIEKDGEDVKVTSIVHQNSIQEDPPNAPRHDISRSMYGY